MRLVVQGMHQYPPWHTAQQDPRRFPDPRLYQIDILNAKCLRDLFRFLQSCTAGPWFCASRMFREPRCDCVNEFICAVLLPQLAVECRAMEFLRAYYIGAAESTA